MEVVGELVQFRETPTPSTCVGSGKLEELKQMILATEAQMVIFDNNLSPSQGRALEQALEKPIVDRSEVILDIFATHARTTEAMLQVELAQLMYYRTRLKRMWTHLERVGGGGTGGNGSTGTTTTGGNGGLGVATGGAGGPINSAGTPGSSPGSGGGGGGGVFPDGFSPGTIFGGTGGIFGFSAFFSAEDLKSPGPNFPGGGGGGAGGACVQCSG